MAVGSILRTFGGFEKQVGAVSTVGNSCIHWVSGSNPTGFSLLGVLEVSTYVCMSPGGVVCFVPTGSTCGAV